MALYREKPNLVSELYDKRQSDHHGAKTSDPDIKRDTRKAPGNLAPFYANGLRYSVDFAADVTRWVNSRAVL